MTPTASLLNGTGDPNPISWPVSLGSDSTSPLSFCCLCFSAKAEERTEDSSFVLHAGLATRFCFTFFRLGAGSRIAEDDVEDDDAIPEGSSDAVCSQLSSIFSELVPSSSSCLGNTACCESCSLVWAFWTCSLPRPSAVEFSNPGGGLGASRFSLGTRSMPPRPRSVP